MKVTQLFGGSYDTSNYPYILLNRTQNKVEGRFSDLKKAHRGRLLTSLNNQNDIILLYNENTKKFIDWRKEDLIKFENKKYI